MVRRRHRRLLDASKLSDEVWLYGGGNEEVRTSIAGGRSGRMPAQKNRLTDMQIRLLTA